MECKSGDTHYWVGSESKKDKIGSVVGFWDVVG